ncbi:hypothetical protein [Psychrobacillus sp. OK032]|uniref:hypothetical protein n=1 Tax=Psychrobacillus sp. OK032 TaxID=1884358 RepID=UPI0008D2D11E|nr:hypothetical protein [Psychrobacillus sp. OK032]SER79220.1 hypothetical protein SAMN05518872_10262 [Psychrobacillus sp. OK032]
MKDSESNNQNNKDSNTVIRAAELAVVGELLSTLGNVISRIASALEVEEERHGQNDNKDMQKQIDYLTIELERLKKQINRGNPSWL